jgi:DHA1 family inner membrane transport protein
MLQTSPTTAPPRGALPALAGAYFTLAVGSLSVVGLLGPMSEGLSVSKSAIAYLVTAFALTYAVAAPLLQMLAGHLDRRTLILTGLCAIAIGTLINAAAPSYTAAH